MDPTTFAVAQNNAELTGSTETIDAATYLTSVETQFQDKPEVYWNFIELMQDLNGQKTDILSTMKQVSSLLQDHLKLIQEFNTFLPPGYQILLPSTINNSKFTIITPEGAATQTEDGWSYFSQKLFSNNNGQSVKDALQLIDEIKTQFHDQPEYYTKFLDTLKDFKDSKYALSFEVPPSFDNDMDIFGRISAPDVVNSMADLFHDQPALLQQFKTFVPSDPPTDPPPNEPFPLEDISGLRARFADDPAKCERLLTLLNASTA